MRPHVYRVIAWAPLPRDLFKRSAHSAGPRSFSKQCCLKVASVKLLARWRSHRFFFSRVGTFGCRFRCLLGAFGDPRAALGVAWGSFGGPLGAFFGVSGAPFGSPGSSREPLSVPGGLFGRSGAAVWPSGSLWGRPPGNSGKFWGPFWGHFWVIFCDFSVYFRVLFFP